MVCGQKFPHLVFDISQLLLRIPVRWGFGSAFIPRHSMLDPAFTPLLVTEAAVVITDTELKTARRADLVRTTTAFRARNFSEFRETTNWTNISHKVS